MSFLFNPEKKEVQEEMVLDQQISILEGFLEDIEYFCIL